MHKSDLMGKVYFFVLQMIFLIQYFKLDDFGYGVVVCALRAIFFVTLE